MLATLAGPGFSLLSLLMVAFANIGTQGTGSYVNCMIIKSGLPKVSYKLLVYLAAIYVSFLTVWGWVMDNFGSFISMAAQIQGPIIGMTVVDYLIVKKRKISLKSLYNIDGCNAYEFTNGFNLVGLGCMIIAFVTNIVFIYNPLTGIIKSPIFMLLTGSGYTAVCGGLLYWLASLTPLRQYMLKDRNEIEIV
jgi:NCS1 family nucleobase:cation symporter-1